MTRRTAQFGEQHIPCLSLSERMVAGQRRIASSDKRAGYHEPESHERERSSHDGFYHCWSPLMANEASVSGKALSG